MTPAEAASRNVRAAGLWLGALVAAYLVSPIATPVHPEGFSAMVASLALHLAHDGLANADRLQPLNVDYFGLTKLGWLLLTASLIKLFDLSGNAALSIIHWLSAIAFAAGSVSLVRRWTGASLPLAAASLLLFPGVVESSFFFNDNLVASAFAISALCALYSPRPWLGSLACGLLFGCAVLTRTDILLVGAAVPLIVVERSGLSRSTLISLLLAGATGVLVWFGTLAAFHASILDVLGVASAAVAAWNRDPMAIKSVGVLIYFLGPLGAMLAACGLLPLWETRDWRRSARFLAVPMVYIGILWSTLWEVRQLLPLTPFLLALAVTGLKGMLADARGPAERLLPAAGVAAVGFWLLSPPIGFALADGPRVFSGRIHNVDQWRGWQHDVRQDFALLARLTQVSGEGARRAIVVDSWNEDRYAHLQLLEAGFSVTSPGPAQCANIAEIFVRAGQRVALVRAQQNYVPYWRQLSGERLARWGRPCLAAFRPQDLHFVADRERFETLTQPEVAAAADVAAAAKEQPRFAPFVAARISGSGLDALIAGYRANAARLAAKGESRGSIEDGVAATRKRSAFGS